MNEIAIIPPIAAEVIGRDDQSICVITCPHPLRSKHEERTFAAGVSLAEIVEAVQPRERMRPWATVYLGDMKISPDLLNRIRPKPGTLVNVKFVPQGGGSAKMLRLIITLAAVALSIAFPYLSPAFASFALQFPVLTAVIQAAIPAVVPIIGPALVGSLNPPRFKCLSSAQH